AAIACGRGMAHHRGGEFVGYTLAAGARVDPESVQPGCVRLASRSGHRQSYVPRSRVRTADGDESGAGSICESMPPLSLCQIRLLLEGGPKGVGSVGEGGQAQPADALPVLLADLDDGHLIELGAVHRVGILVDG